MLKISPSILSADFARLAEALAMLEAGGADAVHVDVMDGHFVPNLTIGPPVVERLSQATTLPLDCHLMIENAERFAVDYVKAGARHVTVHVEACPHLHRTLATIKDAGASCGVALNPATPVAALDEILGELDLVLVMSVNPGFPAQRFIANSYAKLERCAARLAAAGRPIELQVDGGVAHSNAERIVAAGATNLVAGNAIFGAFQGALDPPAALRALRAAALNAQ